MDINLDQHGSIRKTDEEKISVYDLISVVGGKKNPRDCWNRLTEQYPEVVGKCDNWKFSGARQRKTPVCDLTTAYEILGILPGAVGTSYRKEAAELFVAATKGDGVELVKKAAKLSGKSEEQIADEIVKYKLSYHSLMDVLRDKTSGSEDVYKAVNGANTKAVTGKYPYQLVRQRGGKNARASMTLDEAAHYHSLQTVQRDSVLAHNLAGDEPVVEKCQEVADDFAAFIKKHTTPPETIDIPIFEFD